MAFLFLSMIIATYHSCRASNSSIQFIDDASNHARRLIYDVRSAHFDKPKSRFLKAIASMRNDGPNHGGTTDCSGALIAPPDGVKGNFVLTAAHCLYNTTNEETHKRFVHPTALHIEFGLTGDKAPKSPGIIDCRATSYRFPHDYATKSFKSPHDYAVIKLVPLQYCVPSVTQLSAPFVIKNWRTGRKLARAGYRGGRTLKVERHNQRHLPLAPKFNGMAAFDGKSGGGDSGSPIFDEHGQHYVRAVHVGAQKFDGHVYKLAVKITPAVHGEIEKMTKGEAGIPDPKTAIQCKSSNTDKECWSKCDQSCPTARKYERTNMYIPCSRGTQKNYLCKKQSGQSAHISISDEYDDGYNDEYDDEYIDDDVFDEFDDYKKSKNIERIEYEMLLREMGLNDD